MKPYLLLAFCLVLSGCGRQEQSNREVLGKLADIKSELEAKRPETVRWAFANKREIDMAIFQWARDKMEEVKKSEALPPETEQKVQQYEALQIQLMHKEMESRGFKMPPRPGAAEPSTPGETLEALSNRVAEARAPIADILKRRGLRESEYRSGYSTEKLIAEYVQDRFDLVVDSSNDYASHSSVLYCTNGEVLDITDGVLKLFKEKADAHPDKSAP